MTNFYTKNKLSRIINVSGFMTKIGASIVKKQNINAAIDVLSHFVNIDQLQSLASKKISKLLGSEATVITASAAAGLTESIAAMMCKNNINFIYQLPDTKGMKNKVLIQQGHLTNYGAEVGQAIRLSGAKILKCGNKNICHKKHILETIKNNKSMISCAMYVVSHHCSDYESFNIKDFIKLCHKYSIPVIIDAASEEYMEYFFSIDADVCIFSAHKFMKSLTAGIIAGKKKHIRNIYMQNLGIGRGMKVGKEGIYSTITAVESWYKRDQILDLKNQQKIISYWVSFFEKQKYAGLTYEIIPDPTGNKINWLRIHIDKKISGFTIFSLAYFLEKNNPSIFVRDDLIRYNFFELDTCNLKINEEKTVASNINKIIKKILSGKIKHNIYFNEYKKLSRLSLIKWPNLE